MKTIILELSIQATSEETLNNIVEELKQIFTIEDDSKYRFENIRFVNIDADHVHIDIESLGVTLRDIIKPHLFVSIYKKFIVGIEIKY